MTLLDGILGAYDGLPEAEIPAPPEWLALYLYSIFSVRLSVFLVAHGVTSYTVTSGFRTPAKNESVGGAKNSAHVHGLGEDVVIPRPLPLDLLSDWEAMTGGYAVDEGTHVHFNLPRSWGWRVVRWLSVLLLLALSFALMVFYFEVVKHGTSN